MLAAALMNFSRLLRMAGEPKLRAERPESLNEALLIANFREVDLRGVDAPERRLQTLSMMQYWPTCTAAGYPSPSIKEL